ncbi:MAG: 3'-5' exonuclease [Cytophagaceae bacterium]|nr:3'-5' exonuclease [Cytophagaceae bacterium]
MTAEFKQLIKNLLFIDIETVAAQATLDAVPERMRYQWKRKAAHLRSDESQTDADLYFRRAGIYAEFGRVIVIGLGFLHLDDSQQLCLRVRTMGSADEEALLREFANLIETKYRPELLTLCAHNGREFDYPYLCRRMLVNGIPLPKALQLSDRKPWQVNHLDTLELWKFGDKKNYTSLELLAAIFDIPSSKNDLSGDKVNGVFHLENDLARIQEYCIEDVVVLAQLFLRYQGKALIAEEQIDRP